MVLHHSAARLLPGCRTALHLCPRFAGSKTATHRLLLRLWSVCCLLQVQRPGVVEAVGRDTYILRQLAAVARKQAKLNTDLPALVDEWASR